MWLKIKIWTKTIVVGALVLYALLFILNNSGQSVKFWYWFRREYETSMLVLILITFLAGVIGTLLVRTTLSTIRQIREARARARTDRLEREVADMKVKAAMLKTKSAPGSAGASVTSQGLDESA
jgi:uncharacterized integral membrane protein